MRVIFLVIISLCLFSSVKSQPTYDRSFYPEGDQAITQIFMDTNFAGGFSNGANQVWKYPDSSAILDTIENKPIKAAQAPGNDKFPEASIATVNTNNVRGQQTTTYRFFKVTDEQVTELGFFLQAGEGSGFAVSYDDRKIVRKFPLDYKESFEDSNQLSGQGTINGIPITQEGWGYTKVTYDAYGSISNSERTFEDVVRLKTIANDTLNQEIASTNIAIKTSETTYTYKQAGEPEPLITFTEINTVSRGAQRTFQNDTSTLTVSPRLWDPTVGLEEESHVKGVAVMPNPVEANMQVVLGLEKATKVHLKILNMKGQVVKELAAGHIQPGNHIEQLNVSQLPSGTYQLLIRTPETRNTQSIIKK